MEYFCDRKGATRQFSFFTDHYLIFRKMKLTIIFTLLLSLGLNAKTTGQQISLSVRRTSLENVLRRIAQQTDYKFFYSSDLIKNTAPVDLSVEKATLDGTLEQILTPRGLTYQKMSRTITITAHRQQQLSISGT